MAPRAVTRPRNISARRTFLSISADVLVLVIAVASSFSVRLVGSLPVSELILIPLFPILVAIRLPKIVGPGLRVVFVLMGFWLLGQVLTDVYRGTEAIDWTRGDAAIIFFGMDLVGLVALTSGSERRKIIFATGNAIGSLLAVKLQPSVSAAAEPWKFGYASGAILLVVLISCYFYSRRQYLIVGLLLAFIAGANLLQNFRSPVLFLLVTAVLVLPVIPERLGKLRILPRSGGILRVAVLAGLALLAGETAAVLVGLVTSAGLIGEEAQVKNREQSKAGTILGGRPEILVSSIAILDSPILGHGSWARDFKYVEMLDDMRVESGIRSNLAYTESSTVGTIPAHSHLMGSWVWAGILGAVFWAYVLWMTVKSTLAVTTLKSAAAPLYAYMIIGLLWSILFSPFGQGARIWDAFAIVIVADLLESALSRSNILKWTNQGKWRRQGFRGSSTCNWAQLGSPISGASVKFYWQSQ